MDAPQPAGLTADGGRDPAFAGFAWRVVLAHTATYLVAGVLASTLLDYRTWWDSPWMAHFRPFDSPWVAFGPVLQVVRGLILAVVLYPFRERILAPGGWIALWGLLCGVGILSTYGPAPGSVEGVIYTALPPQLHLFGLPEVTLQALAFSACLVGWHRRPHRAWGLVLGALTGFAVLTGLAGALIER